MSKLKKTYDQVFLDDLYYLDFYSIDRFGKTKLGQLLLYAKQSQEIVLMNELINTFGPSYRKTNKTKKCYQCWVYSTDGKETGTIYDRAEKETTAQGQIY